MKGRCDMKVCEMINMITSLSKAVVTDINTMETIYDDECDSRESEAYNKCKDLEVNSIETYTNEKLTLYVNATKTYSTWLDVTYSTKVTLTVPITEDEGDAFRNRGEELVKLLPKEFQFGDVKFSIDMNNMDYGNYYDMIEEVGRE